jgi:putative acetyltransferase
MRFIRAERPEDTPLIRDVISAAFETAAEADLVDVLRQQARPIVSLVALERDAVVGHILFSSVTVSSHQDVRMMGLAPLAVVPGRQRTGIGSELVRAGLEECRRLGFAGVVVLGHAAYYPRFGFAPASRFGLVSEYDVPDEVFMALELETGALRGKSGTVRYHPAFASELNRDD